MLRSKQLKLVMLVIALSLLVTCGLAANKRILINDEEVQFTSISGFPFIDSAERIQVPFRATLEKFGATVSFDSTTSTAIAEKDGIKVEVPIGKKQILRNGVAIPVDTAGLIKEGRTYLPIRAVMEAFGCEVEWDGAKGAVSINFTEKIDNVVFDNYVMWFELDSEMYKNYYDGKIAVIDGNYYVSRSVATTLMGIVQDNYVIKDTSNPYIKAIYSGAVGAYKAELIHLSATESYVKVVFYNEKSNKSYALTTREADENRLIYLSSLYFVNLEKMLDELQIDLDYGFEINREEKTVTFIINE